jgi:hypothetical protein
MILKAEFLAIIVGRRIYKNYVSYIKMSAFDLSALEDFLHSDEYNYLVDKMTYFMANRGLSHVADFGPFLVNLEKGTRTLSIDKDDIYMGILDRSEAYLRERGVDNPRKVAEDALDYYNYWDMYSWDAVSTMANPDSFVRGALQEEKVSMYKLLENKERDWKNKRVDAKREMYQSMQHDGYPRDAILLAIADLDRNAVETNKARRDSRMKLMDDAYGVAKKEGTRKRMQKLGTDEGIAELLDTLKVGERSSRSMKGTGMEGLSQGMSQLRVGKRRPSPYFSSPQF